MAEVVAVERDIDRPDRNSLADQGLHPFGESSRDWDAAVPDADQADWRRRWTPLDELLGHPFQEPRQPFGVAKARFGLDHERCLAFGRRNPGRRDRIGW
jgi:hypothetical protein